MSNIDHKSGEMMYPEWDKKDGYIGSLEKRVKALEEKVNSMETNWKCISGTLDRDVLIGSDNG